MEGLTKKQRAFVNAYLGNGGNATQAALKAGYAKASAHTTAHKMLKLPKIQKLLSKQQEKNAEAEDITRASQIEKLKAIYEKALRARQFGAAVKSIEVINKMLGFETPKETQQTNIFLALPLETRMQVLNQLKKVG